MSVFGNIMSAIFRHGAGSAAPAEAGPAATPSQPKTGAGNIAGSDGASSAAPPTAGSAALPQSQVDVEGVLNSLARQSKEKLDWRRSIVDLMKLLKLDSSLSARQELARELHYQGDLKDSAAMNMWLHKQVMSRLAANGGKLPPEIKH